MKIIIMKNLCVCVYIIVNFYLIKLKYIYLNYLLKNK